jgi:hypothetical protein
MKDICLLQISTRFSINDSDFPEKRGTVTFFMYPGEKGAYFQDIPRAADISESASFSGSLTATPCSFEASATFCPMARTHFL